MRKLVMAAIALVVLSSCSTNPVSSGPTDNEALRLDLMFTKDGCRMYRFNADGRNHYWATCGGYVSNDYSYWVSTGPKGQGYMHTVRDDIQTSIVR